MAWARTVKYDDNVIYQKKRWWLPRWLDSAWVNRATAKDALYKVTWEIIQKKEEMDALLGRFAEIQEQVEAELNDAKKQPKDRWGRGLPFRISRARLRDLEKESVSKPPDDWKELFSPKYRQKYKLSGPSGSGGKASTTSTDHVINSGSPHSGKTMYIEDGLAQKSVHFGGEEGAGEVMAFKFPDEKKGQQASNDRKVRRRNLVSDNPRWDDESEGEYNKRIDRLLKEQDSSSKDHS